MQRLLHSPQGACLAICLDKFLDIILAILLQWGHMVQAAVWGPYVRRLRDHVGVSQDGLARIVGVTPKTVHRWETERSRPHDIAVDRVRQVAAESGFEPPPSRPRPRQLSLLEVAPTQSPADPAVRRVGSEHKE
jgi:transcriptional regulator with XRE-family HTH domain